MRPALICRMMAALGCVIILEFHPAGDAARRPVEQHYRDDV
jgi:hypothetical protein